jgi:adenosylcobinamide kinase/adenosylcobinamide-phosphate guanylyltransferase
MAIPRRLVPGLDRAATSVLQSVSVSPAGDALSWLSNLFERESHTPARRQQEILMAAVRDLAAASTVREVIAVSNEVGGGIVPATRVGRRFRDLQGWANQILAEEAGSVTLVVAGLPLVLKGQTRF